MSEIEHFMPLLMQREEEGALAPLLSHGRVHFLWIKHSNLYCIRPLVGFLEAWDGGGSGPEGVDGGQKLHSTSAVRVGEGWTGKILGSVLHLRRPKWHLFLNFAAHSGGHHTEERQRLPRVLLPLQDGGGRFCLPIGQLVCPSTRFALLFPDPFLLGSFP